MSSHVWCALPVGALGHLRPGDECAWPAGPVPKGKHTHACILVRIHAMLLSTLLYVQNVEGLARSSLAHNDV
jgi:hypothetical protein